MRIIDKIISVFTDSDDKKKQRRHSSKSKSILYVHAQSNPNGMLRIAKAKGKLGCSNVTINKANFSNLPSKKRNVIPVRIKAVFVNRSSEETIIRELREETIRNKQAHGGV